MTFVFSRSPARALGLILAALLSPTAYRGPGQRSPYLLPATNFLYPLVAR